VGTVIVFNVLGLVMDDYNENLSAMKEKINIINNH